MNSNRTWVFGSYHHNNSNWDFIVISCYSNWKVVRSNCRVELLHEFQISIFERISEILKIGIRWRAIKLGNLPFWIGGDRALTEFAGVLYLVLVSQVFPTLFIESKKEPT
jgi:hypothetical protein